MSLDDGDGYSDTLATPSKVWWVAHVVFWIISGLICYLVWKDRNREAAKRHLIHSLWLPFAAYGLVVVVVMLAFPGEW